MCISFQLITPAPHIVEKYNNFRKKDNNDWSVALFQNCSEIDIRDYIVKKNEDGSYDSPYDKYSKNDEVIADYYNKGNIPSFLKELNKTYHTRLNTECLFGLNKKWFISHNVDDLVDYYYRNSKKGKKTPYSFCSKVYSFVNEKENPIMDSYVSTLLWEYMSTEYKKKHSKSDWGSYAEYKTAYGLFKKKYGLTDYSYKQLDVFLWTYAVAIQNYWERIGVIKFDSVAYKSS